MIHLKAILCLGLLAALATTSSAQNECRRTARMQQTAANLELRADLEERLAVCLNLGDYSERLECTLDALIEYGEGALLARDQYQARLQLCGRGDNIPTINAGFCVRIRGQRMP